MRWYILNVINAFFFVLAFVYLCTPKKLIKIIILE